MNKNSILSGGLPLFVDHQQDMKPYKGAPSDSWYVNFAFEAEGKQLGVMWHHQHLKIGPVTVAFSELLLLNGTDNYVLKETAKIGKPQAKVNQDSIVIIPSSIGELKASKNGLTLKSSISEGAVDLSFKPTSDVLYNGTTGLLPLVGSDSHEFAYPNMEVSGTVTMKGHQYTVQNAQAWFDRQWTTQKIKDKDFPEKASWLWLGLTLNEKGDEAISLWDYYMPGKRNAFSTIRRSDGVYLATNADITYSNIWTSSETGRRYPMKVTISIPEENLALNIVCMVDDVEFVQRSGGMLQSVCQNLCHVTGIYHTKQIDKYAVLELVGNICGE